MSANVREADRDQFWLMRRSLADWRVNAVTLATPWGGWLFG
jgi:hypothetical protein